jgi:hypothetical protein
MRARQSVFPSVSRSVIRAFSDEPVLIDGMKLEFDEKVALYPASVEVTDDGASDSPRIRRESRTPRRR